MDIFDVHIAIYLTKLHENEKNGENTESDRMDRSKSKSWEREKIQRHAVPITAIDRNWLYRLTVKIVESNNNKNTKTTNNQQRSMGFVVFIELGKKKKEGE